MHNKPLITDFFRVRRELILAKVSEQIEEEFADDYIQIINTCIDALAVINNLDFVEIVRDLLELINYQLTNQYGLSL